MYRVDAARPSTPPAIPNAFDTINYQHTTAYDGIVLFVSSCTTTGPIVVPFATNGSFIIGYSFLIIWSFTIFHKSNDTRSLNELSNNVRRHCSISELLPFKNNVYLMTVAAAAVVVVWPSVVAVAIVAVAAAAVIISEHCKYM